MREENRQCQNCKNQFSIEPEDFSFYKKMQVPAPTWCSECRLRRRMIIQSERALYPGTCDLCHKAMISVYQQDVPFPVYCPACWFSDNWDPIDFGQDYNFKKPFFAQYRELMEAVPRIALNFEYTSNVNSPYVNLTGAMKNSHLIFYAAHVEDSLYCTSIYFSRDCMDCTKINETESSYGLVNCEKCYGSVSSVDCMNSHNLTFCKNCTGCSDCFGCVNLRHKQYCWFNEQLMKDAYEEKLREYNLGSQKMFEEAKQRAQDFWLRYPAKYMHGTKNEDVDGDYIYSSKDVHKSFDVRGAENVKFGHWLNMAGTKDSYDYSNWGEDSDLVYECNISGQNLHNVKFCQGCWHGSNWEYCDTLNQCNDCVACIALRNKKNCILNKPYTKEEYKTLYPKVIKHMHDMPYIDEQGREYRYGEFFPPELSPFAYNETIAQQHFPLTKEEAMAQGWKWRDPEQKTHRATIKAKDLPDNIKDVKEEILQQVILCEHAGRCKQQCSYVFKIIPQELDFLRRFSLPLPGLCPNCRHYERMKNQNPINLWHRECLCHGAKSGEYTNTAEHFHGSNPCPNEFETSYNPERKEIVYCETCYQAEVA